MVSWSYVRVFCICFWHLLKRNAEGSDLRTKFGFVTNIFNARDKFYHELFIDNPNGCVCEDVHTHSSMSGFSYDGHWQASIVVSIVSFILLDVAFIKYSVEEPELDAIIRVDNHACMNE